MKRLLLPAVLATILAAGCAQNSTPAPYGSCATQPSKPQAVRTSAAPELKAKAQAAADDAGKPASCIVAAPLFRPDFRAGVRFDETQRMRFSFSKEAVSEGAPEQIPDFSASIIVKGDSISASLSALNTPFWRISATPSTTAESRHPLLSSRFRAKGLIRDLTFMYWPVDSIRASLAKTCPDCTLSVSGSTRTLARSGQRVLESSTRGGATVLTLRDTSSPSSPKAPDNRGQITQNATAAVIRGRFCMSSNLLLRTSEGDTIQGNVINASWHRHEKWHTI